MTRVGRLGFYFSNVLKKNWGGGEGVHYRYVAWKYTEEDKKKCNYTIWVLFAMPIKRQYNRYTYNTIQ